MEVVLETILLVLVNYPAGFIRWIIFRKKPLKDYVYDDFESNVGIAILLLIIIIVGIFAYKSIGPTV